MDKKYFLDEAYLKRRKKANAVLEKGLESVNFADPGWDQKIERLSKLYREMTTDDHNVNEALLELERLRVEEEKNKVDAENEADRLAIEDLRDRETAENNKARNWIDRVKIGAELTIAAIGGAVGVWKFKQSTKKEEDGAYLTVTDKTTVQEGLRTPSRGGLFKFW